jgi:succinate-acetate transporter protein
MTCYFTDGIRIFFIFLTIFILLAIQSLISDKKVFMGNYIGICQRIFSVTIVLGNVRWKIFHH